MQSSSQETNHNKARAHCNLYATHVIFEVCPHVFLECRNYKVVVSTMRLPYLCALQ